MSLGHMWLILCLYNYEYIALLLSILELVLMLFFTDQQKLYYYRGNYGKYLNIVKKCDVML